MSLSSTLSVLFQYASEIGAISDSNDPLQNQIAARVALHLSEQDETVSALTVYELAQLIRTATEEVNGGAA